MKLTNSMFFLLLFSTFQLLSCTNGGEGDLPQIMIQSQEVREANVLQTVGIQVSLSKAAMEEVTFLVSTRERTALEGEDFVKMLRVPVSIPAGAQEASIELEIIGDREFEEEEIFFLAFEQPTGAELAEEIIQITLIDDDSDPIASLEGPTSPLSYPGMQLIWQEEFDLGTLDGNTWTQEVREEGWFNEELQYYTPDNRNLSVRDGNLVIEARAESHTSTTGRVFDYTSARLSSQGNFDFTYGRVDIRAAMPEGQGIWPALWMLGANIDQVGWPACGEIDMLEMIGGDDIPGQKGESVAHSAIHWQGASAKESKGFGYDLPEGSLHGAYHVYSIIWDETEIQFLIDDVIRTTFNIEASHMSEFHAPHFFILNVAVGGTWPGSPDATTVFPQQMAVDYIRVFQ